jgi:3-polyprenyl-4-hydroxybenzoate decarboxylase
VTDKSEVLAFKSVAATKEKMILVPCPVRGLSSMNERDNVEADSVVRSEEVVLEREGSVLARG